MGQEADNNRRTFLGRATRLLGGAVAAVVAVPLAGYALFPVGRKVVGSGAAQSFDLIEASKLQVDAPPQRLALVATGVRDGWSVKEEVTVGAVYLRKDKDGRLVALSAACPHRGCSVEFHTSEGEFFCPCHKATFAPNGKRLSGPPKRDLDELPVQVVGGRVVVEHVRFRPGIDKKVQV